MAAYKTRGQAPNFGFGHSNKVSTGIIQTEGDINIFFQTFEFVKLFTVEICQNYFREEINVDRRIPTFLPQMMLEDTDN